MNVQRLDAAQIRTTLLVEQLQPIILREIAAAERRAVHAEAREEAIMNACKALGRAVDRLLQARHTQAEGPARAALERAALSLRRQMRKADG